MGTICPCPLFRGNMGRQKKIKVVQEEETKKEVPMSQEVELESVQTELDQVRVELERTKKEIEEKKHELQLVGKRDIDESERKLIDKQVSRGNKSAALLEKIEKQKVFDNQKVTGKFINRRAPGQPAKLTYMKYEDDPVKWYTLEDGKIYTLPRGFADQINEYYHTPRFIPREGPLDPSSPQSQIQEVDTSNKKYAFMPVNF